MEDIKALAKAYLEMQEAKKKKMDDVDPKELEKDFDDREDQDLDNDGDTDKSDKYLHNRRKTVKKAMADDDKKSMEESVETEADKHRKLADMHKEKMLDAKDEDHRDGMTAHRMAHDAHQAAAKAYDKAADPHTAVGAKMASQKAIDASKKARSVFEAKDLNTDNAAKALQHDCATHVQHEQYGLGKCIPGQHTLVAIDETRGYVTHYDVEFEHGIVEDVAVEDLKIIDEMSHGHPRKKKGMRESFADHAGYEVKGWEVVQENEDGTFDAFINGELYMGITEEKAKELKHKNVAKAQPEGQEKLEPRAQGEKDFVAQHGAPEVKDNPETVKQDGAGSSQAPTRRGDRRANEPMKSVSKTQGQ